MNEIEFLIIGTLRNNLWMDTSHSCVYVLFVVVMKYSTFASAGCKFVYVIRYIDEPHSITFRKMIVTITIKMKWEVCKINMTW